MKKVIACFAIFATTLLACPLGSVAQNKTTTQQQTNVAATVSKMHRIAMHSMNLKQMQGLLKHKSHLQTIWGFTKCLSKVIDGNAGFMSLVALALVLGLAFCIERIIYLSLSEIDAKRFVGKLEDMIVAGEIEQAKALSRDTRGPVASICYQGLLRIDDSIENIERSVTSYGSVQSANLEKGCSWITLFIAMAPSLGFLGTVIGMVMAFDQIQEAGDISPTIVASGMKVALIYDHLRYHRCPCTTSILQLHPL